ncbi:MAG: hypothetical protein ACXWMH_04135 [Syntrophales bacterium]
MEIYFLSVVGMTICLIGVCVGPQYILLERYLYIIVSPVNSRTIPMIVNTRFIHLIQFGAAWASLRKTFHDQKLQKTKMIERIISARFPVT